MRYFFALLTSSLIIPATASAQEEDLLKLVPQDTVKKTYVKAPFRSPRIIMTHSLDMLNAGVFDFRVMHRFEKINGGLYEFFGLDGFTNVRLGFSYGISKNFSAGIGRSRFDKEYDGYLKYRVVQQAKGKDAFPLSIVVAGGTVIRTLKWNDGRTHPFSDRVSYYLQAPLGRKFSEAFTLQITPTYIHRNFLPTPTASSDIYATGMGGRIKLGRRVSLNADYYLVPDRDLSLGAKNPLALGLDIETGGHVFQLHFTNARGMNEKAFITQTEYDWGDGEILFGFNISRVFQIKKRSLKTAPVN